LPGVAPDSIRRMTSFRSDPAKRESEESAGESLIDSAQWNDPVSGIDQVNVLQIPPRALRALVGMTSARRF
jgi:hypothetical protein